MPDARKQAEFAQQSEAENGPEQRENIFRVIPGFEIPEEQDEQHQIQQRQGAPAIGPVEGGSAMPATR